MRNTPDTLARALALVEDGTLSIDSEGRIWRHAIISHGRRLAIAPRRAESIGGKGYLRVMLQIDGRIRGVAAHRLVWTHLNGPIPEGRQINHRDLNKKNNRPDNLEVVTGAENIQHSYANGRPAPWNRATTWRGRARLTPEQIATAREMRANGALIREIAQSFGISVTHAQRVTS